MLNVEEKNLLMEFDVSSKEAALQDIRRCLPYIEDPDLFSSCTRLLEKMEAMSEEEAASLNYNEEEIEYVR